MMKKIFLLILFLLFSQAVWAQGFSDREGQLFPSWWGTEISEEGRQEIKNMKQELEGLRKEKKELEEERGIIIAIRDGVLDAREMLGLVPYPDPESEKPEDQDIIEVNNELARVVKKIQDKVAEREKQIQKIKDRENQIRVSEKKIQPVGIIGYSGDEKLIIQYIPRLIDILLKFVAPIVLAMFIFSGIRLIYAAGNEEDVTKSKDFFVYALLGVLFIVISYSLMKALYFILA